VKCKHANPIFLIVILYFGLVFLWFEPLAAESRNTSIWSCKQAACSVEQQQVAQMGYVNIIQLLGS
jgi:hypothetical protein